MSSPTSRTAPPDMIRKQRTYHRLPPGTGTARTAAAKRPRHASEVSWWGRPPAVFGVIALVLVTWICYTPALQNQFTNWDDDLYVTNNSLIQRVSAENLLRVATGPVAFNYHPLTVWSLQANYLQSGLSPAPYYLTNVLLHLLNCLLVFHLLFRLTRGVTEASIAGAFLFAVHPMHVESVAWVAERKDVLYAFFVLLGLVTYMRYLRRGARGWGALVVVLLFTLLALLSKPAAVVMPLLLVALDHFEGRKLLSRKALGEKLPFVALSIAFSIITLRIQSDFVAVGDLQELSWPGRILVASYGLTMYMLKFVLPGGLSAFYPYPDFAKGWPPAFLAAPAVIAVIAAVTLWSLRRSRVITSGMLLFLVPLLPVLQFVPVGLAVIADRYTYLPHVGLALIVAYGYRSLEQQWERRPARLQAVRVALAAGVIAMAVLTWQRVAVWRTSETLWTDVIEKHPTVGRAYVSRGVHRFKVNGDLVGAMRDLNKGVELAPDGYLGFYNRGLVHQNRGDTAQAITDYTRAIAVNSIKTEPYVNRGALLVQQGRYDAAIGDFDRVLAVEPENVACRFNRAAAHYRAGRYEQAIADYKSALELDPSRTEERFLQGVCEHRLGRFDAALESYGAAIASNPTQGRYYLFRARCLALVSRPAEAARDAQKAVNLGIQVEQSLLGMAH